MNKGSNWLPDRTKGQRSRHRLFSFQQSMGHPHKTKKVKWEYGGRKYAQYTYGTHLGLQALLSMRSNGVLLADYLSHQPAYSTITITGHSLGGALAPALGLALFHPHGHESFGLPSLSDKTGRIYPTAGPDVGNEPYQDSIHDVFQETDTKGYAQWDRKTWHKLDMVPQVWSKKFLPGVNTIYDEHHLQTPKHIQNIINWKNEVLNVLDPLDPIAALDHDAKGHFDDHFQPVSNFNCKTCKAVLSHDSLKTECEFWGEALYQHIAAYIKFFKLDGISAVPNIKPCSVAQLFHALKVGATCDDEP